MEINEKDFFSFIQEAGLIWGPSPEIYGGLAGFYTYGPLGKLLKNKVENSIRKVFNSYGFREIESPTILPDVVWKASGHLNTFKDRVISCSKCNSTFRADKLIESFSPSPESLSDEKILSIIKQQKIKCLSCKSNFKYEIKKYSLMIKTSVGGKESSLRPETATATYLSYPHLYNYFRKKLPFAVFQIGKAYRNEISPRQHVLRGREFTQAEAQLFINPSEKNQWPPFKEILKKTLPLWPSMLQKNPEEKIIPISLNSAIKKKFINSEAYAWCLYIAYMQFINFGIAKEKIRIRQHHPEEKAFYAKDAWDIEIKLNNYSWVEMCGVHDRTDYDLSQHEKFSGIKLEARAETGFKFKPHILEIAFGSDRPTYALMNLFYEKRSKKEGKTIFKIPYHMAPIEIAIFPLLKKESLINLSKKIKSDLEKNFIVEYDQNGSIGKRYLRASIQGIPFCITVDYESLKNKDVTIRDRNNEKQIRVPIKELKKTLYELFEKEKSIN